eukprot:TRINITY_DN19611_c0_g1_i1.p1 TRINITY_DN19611_c0_g1~~TRINITY_DN19611_c0_g1_i1.p1  ORF type:complete len:792 (+),score=85.77 TRINITY_DN19611_c0_g1_i1:93-2468(+)
MSFLYPAPTINWYPGAPCQSLGRLNPSGFSYPRATEAKLGVPGSPARPTRGSADPNERYQLSEYGRDASASDASFYTMAASQFPNLALHGAPRTSTPPSNGNGAYTNGVEGLHRKGNSRGAGAGHLLINIDTALDVVPLDSYAPHRYCATAYYPGENEDEQEQRKTSSVQANPSSSGHMTEDCILQRRVAVPYNPRQQLLMVEVFEADPDNLGHDSLVGRVTLPLADPKLGTTTPWPLIRGNEPSGTLTLNVQFPDGDDDSYSPRIPSPTYPAKEPQAACSPPRNYHGFGGRWQGAEKDLDSPYGPPPPPPPAGLTYPSHQIPQMPRDGHSNGYIAHGHGPCPQDYGYGQKNGRDPFPGNRHGNMLQNGRDPFPGNGQMPGTGAMGPGWRGLMTPPHFTEQSPGYSPGFGGPPGAASQGAPPLGPAPALPGFTTRSTTRPLSEQCVRGAGGPLLTYPQGPGPCGVNPITWEAVAGPRFDQHAQGCFAVGGSIAAPVAVTGGSSSSRARSPIPGPVIRSTSPIPTAALQTPLTGRSAAIPMGEHISSPQRQRLSADGMSASTVSRRSSMPLFVQPPQVAMSASSLSVPAGTSAGEIHRAGFASPLPTMPYRQPHQSTTTTLSPMAPHSQAQLQHFQDNVLDATLSPRSPEPANATSRQFSGSVRMRSTSPVPGSLQLGPAEAQTLGASIRAPVGSLGGSVRLRSAGSPIPSRTIPGRGISAGSSAPYSRACSPIGSHVAAAPRYSSPPPTKMTTGVRSVGYPTRHSGLAVSGGSHVAASRQLRLGDGLRTTR